jgi:hypothetical protein
MALVIRTDFSDQRRWDALRAAIAAPVGDFGFLADVEFVNDRVYAGLGTRQLLESLPKGGAHTFVIVADPTTMSQPEHPLLIVDLHTDRGREFRAIPSAIQAIENNLSLANMDFAEFADSVDADGVFRGFPEP